MGCRSKAHCRSEMIYRFGDCVVDREARQLVVAGRVVTLPSKAFSLLCLLVEERPRVLSKSDLLERLWPETHVSEANLPVLIKALRVATGDRASQSTYIRTHHRIGYAFVAQVTESPSTVTVPLGGPTTVLRIGARRVRIGPGPFIVGRDAVCDVVIHDPCISRRHARITIRDGCATVVDLRSKNGTTIDQRRIDRPTIVRNGDRIRFGAVECEFAVEMPLDDSTQAIDSDVQD